MEVAPARRLMSLKDPFQKMSKSHRDPSSRILLTDSPDEIHMKVKNALTDSIAGVSYEPVQRPGVSNLLEVLSYFDKEQKSCKVLAKECEGLSLRSFKELVADTIVENLAFTRLEYQRLTAPDHKEDLEAISQSGGQDARLNAQRMMIRVRNAIGL